MMAVYVHVHMLWPFFTIRVSHQSHTCAFLKVSLRPICFKEQTVHFNNGMRLLFKGLSDPDMEKPESSCTHRLLGAGKKIKINFKKVGKMFACVLTKISENTAVWESWQIKYELNCHISETQSLMWLIFIVRVQIKAALGQHNSFQQTEEFKEGGGRNFLTEL